jgi:hypothetical protein
MANVTAYQAIDMMSPGSTWQGTATSASTSYIRIESYPHRQDFYGSFSYSSQTGQLQSGAVSQIYYYEYGSTTWSATSLSLDIFVYNSYVTANNVQGLYAYVLNGSDTVTGSNFSDHIRSFSGNDTIQAGDGNDYLDGERGRMRLTVAWE